jgi:hypothetical protein
MLIYIFRWSYGGFEEEHEEGRPYPLDWESVKDYVLRKEAPVPPLYEIKDFFRFYVKQSKGYIKEHASVRSTSIMAVSFFSGFARVTGTPVDEEYKEEVSKVRASSCWAGTFLIDRAHSGLKRCCPEKAIASMRLSRNTILVLTFLTGFCSGCGLAQILPYIFMRGRGPKPPSYCWSTAGPALGLAPSLTVVISVVVSGTRYAPLL